MTLVPHPLLPDRRAAGRAMLPARHVPGRRPAMPPTTAPGRSPRPTGGDMPTPRTYFVLEGEPGAPLKDSLRVRTSPQADHVHHLRRDRYNTAEDGFFALKAPTSRRSTRGLDQIRSPAHAAGRTQVDSRSPSVPEERDTRRPRRRRGRDEHRDRGHPGRRRRRRGRPARRRRPDVRPGRRRHDAGARGHRRLPRHRSRRPAVDRLGPGTVSYTVRTRATSGSRRPSVIELSGRAASSTPSR